MRRRGASSIAANPAIGAGTSGTNRGPYQMTSTVSRPMASVSGWRAATSDLTCASSKRIATAFWNPAITGEGM